MKRAEDKLKIGDIVLMSIRKTPRLRCSETRRGQDVR